MHVLFVCKSNVGRSQTAEALFLKVSKHNASSVGTVVGDKEGMRIKDLGWSAQHVIECLKEDDCDVSNNLRKQLTPEMVKKADKVIIMAEPETVPNYIKSSDKVIYWQVDNPKNTSLERHREIKNQIKKLVEGLVGEIG